MNCGSWHNVIMPCGDRTCPECRRVEMLKARRKYLPHLKEIHRPKLLTLTWPNQKFISRKLFIDFRKCWSKLIRRKPFSTLIKGGLFTFEVTNKGNGWHVHAHILLDAAYIPQKSLSIAWKAITGQAFIVDIRVAKNPKIALNYILKYISKTPELLGSKEDYNKALKGVRTIQGFGSMYRIKYIKKPMPCKKCGSTSWVPEFIHDMIIKGNYLMHVIKQKSRLLKDVISDYLPPPLLDLEKST